MKYMDILKESFVSIDETIPAKKEEVSEANKDVDPEELLRKAGFKIKLTTPTSFGTQIDFARKYSAEEINKVLHGINYKVKNNSVFIL